MRIKLIAVGTRVPDWVQLGFTDYASRLPRECRLELKEIPAGRRTGGKGEVKAAVRREGERMLAALGRAERVVALEERGRQFDTHGLAGLLSKWMGEGGDTALLLGGPDGLAQGCLERASLSWSLSRLTLPHALARVVVAEAIYRAWTVLRGHPYHRS